MNLQLGRTRIFAAVLLSIFGAVSASAQKTTPVVLISVQPNPVVNGSNVTISVTVKPATGVAAPALPSGQVTINATASCAANVQLGVVTLDSSGNGQLMVSTWPCAGAFTVVASYAGDANFLTANSAALIVTVLSQYTQTTTTLASSQNPSTVGQSVTLSATLTYTFTLLTRPSGTITFTDTNTNTVLGSAAVATGSGTHTVTGAFITISNLAPGSYSVQASYSGDNIYAGSTSSIVIQVVQQSAPSVTTTALTVSAGQVTQSTSVTFTATVTSKAGDIPTGPVTFTSDGATTLGVVNLDSTGTATLSISTLAIGTHQIVAAYGGSSTDGASSSSPVSVTVTTPPPAPTTTTLTSSANPVTAGTAITLTATVTSAAPGTPTGSVEFFDGPTLLATAAVDQTGTAVLTGVSLPVGVHQLSAIYSGDSTFAGSQGTGTETVNAPPPASPTTTSISSSANPSVFGQTITFSASVSVSTGVATGSVTFTIGSTSTQVPLDNTGTATLTTAALPVGSTNVTATYGGDSGNAGSVSATLVQGVNQAATTTIVTSSISQSASGQIVTFTATVTINPPGAGTPTGSVSFVADGSNTVCSAVPLQSGTAVCSTSSFAPGSHTVVATYSGDADLTSSNGQIQVNVNSNQAATSTALTSSPNPSVFGQAVTFTATVTVNAPGSGTPTGTMSFQADGPNSLCASVLLDANGMANCTVSSLALGKHMITANYTPNSNLGASFAVTYQNVNQATTSTAVISSPNPSVFGQAVTLTATVTVNAPGSGIPTGTVTFTDGSSAVCAKVPLGSNVTAICTINTLATGMHAITATYSGDGNFMPSGGQSSQTITKDATNTQVSSSASVLTVGQTVTFTATVKATPPGSGTATGTVSFMANGSITLCASVALQPNGTASCTVGNLSSGSQSITATYTGDQNFLGSSNSTSVTVNAQTAGGTADLAIKQIEDHKVVQGQLFAYSIRVTNMGPNSANIVIMNDALPSGTVFLESKQSAGSCAGPAIGTSGAVTCTTPRLEPGHSWQIFITVKITAPRGTVVTNTATVGSTTSDPNLSNNQASVNLLVVLPRDNRETAK